MLDVGSTLRLQDVSVTYGSTRALDGVTLRIDAGESVALIGPSGAGKTSLLKLFNAAVNPSAGEVIVDDQSLATLAPTALKNTRSDIGFIHQDLGLVPNLRVVQNVVSGGFGRLSLWAAARAMLFPSSATVEAVYQLLDQVGIADKLFQRTDTLSGGQRQRVAIARALYQQPSALLCDEPVSSVDPSRAQAVLELLRALSAERGITLCVSLHNVALARALFPRLIGIRDGRVAFDKASSEISSLEIDQLYQFADNAVGLS